MLILANLHEAIKNTDPEHIKLTLQNIPWKIKIFNQDLANEPFKNAKKFSQEEKHGSILLNENPE